MVGVIHSKEGTLEARGGRWNLMFLGLDHGGLLEFGHMELQGNGDRRRGPFTKQQSGAGGGGRLGWWGRLCLVLDVDYTRLISGWA